MREFTVIITVGMVVLASLAFVDFGKNVGGVIPEGSSPAYTAHAPIRINSDADFAIGINGVTAGDGSPGNPWIIEGWDIDGGSDCIYIGNATDPFNILNCSLHGASGTGGWPYFTGSGILLNNVQNGTVSRNNATNGYYGILLINSGYCVVLDNNVSSNYWGIMTEGVNQSTIEENNVSMNRWDGIYVQNSLSNIVDENTLIDNGQFGVTLRGADGNIIRDNYQSTGRSGYYCTDNSELNTFVNNTAVTNTDSGITLYFTSGNKLYRNTLVDSRDGIYISYSEDDTMMGNSMVNNGIYFIDSNTRAISHTITSNNTVNGKPVYYWKNQISGTVPAGAGQVILANCTGVTVQNQVVTSGTLGISLLYSPNNYIINNDASMNTRGGIILHESDSNSITGNTADSITGYGIFLSYSCHSTISNNEVKGFYISGWETIHWNSHTIDTSNTVYGKPVYYWKDRTSGTVPPGAGQVILANCVGVTVSDQSINGSYVGVLLGFADGNIIRNMSVSDSVLDGISLIISNKNELYDNVVSSNNGNGILCNGAHNSVLIGNTASSNTYSGIRLRGCDYVVMKENIAFSNGENGIYFDNSYECFLGNNDCDSNQESGIYLLGGAKSTLMNNTAEWNTESGFCCWGANENLLVNNTAKNDNDGFRLWSTSSNMLYRNNASFSTFCGFYIIHSDNSVIRNNDAFSNQYGIVLGYSDQCQIRENRLSYNWMRGLEIPYTSMNNTIYHNFFHNNAVNAYDINDNIWNASYPKGGNRWSDYAGNDVFGGTQQDQPGADGIGDVPYTNIMNTLAKDHYPLMAGTLNRPNIELVSPANNSMIANGIAVRLDVWDRDVDVQTVNYSVNGGTFETLDFPFAVDTSNWLEGTNNLTICAVDDDLNSISAVFSFLTDSNPPDVDAGPDVFTNKQFIQNATASDDVAGIANYSWCQVSGVGTITFDDPSAEDTAILADADGLYTIQLTVTDNFGHMAMDNLTVTWDTVLPVVSAGANVTTNSRFYQNATTNDTGSGIGTCRWAVASGPGDISFGDLEEEDTTMEAAFDGTYIVELNVSDKAGNWACDQFTLIWDTTPPDIQVAVLGNRTGFWLNITDDNFLSAYCAYGGANASCAGTEFFDTSSLAPGWYNYSVWANDLANNSISDRITLCIESTPPPLAIVNTMPANGNVQVSIHENISIEFNQPMNVSSVINAIEITELPLDATLNYTWNVENTILTIEVIPGFSQNTLYTVSVGSGAESIYGITLAKDYIFSFTTWTDSDGDNIPDNIDEDDDNDGIADPYDAFPLDPSESLDTDDDGTGNNADPDDDNDGVPDTDDAFPLDPTEWLDTDNDGIGNNADPDDDNDGVPDTEDYEPLDPSVTKAQTFVGRYWWAITILAVVSVVGVAVYILRKRKLPQASEPENIEDSEDQQDTG